MTEAVPPDALRAVSLVGSLWTAIRAKGGPHFEVGDYHVLRGVFEPSWLDELPLPIGEDRPDSQIVALAHPTQFDRPATPDTLEEAYRKQPRTRIYESVDGCSEGWPRLAAGYLERLADCLVTCTVYESKADDGTIGVHRDSWYGAIIQARGEKEWLLGEDATARSATPTLAMAVGDVLLLPQGVWHDVRTRRYSVHLGFAFLGQSLAK